VRRGGAKLEKLGAVEVRCCRSEVQAIEVESILMEMELRSFGWEEGALEGMSRGKGRRVGQGEGSSCI